MSMSRLSSPIASASLILALVVGSCGRPARMSQAEGETRDATYFPPLPTRSSPTSPTGAPTRLPRRTPTLLPSWTPTFPPTSTPPYWIAPHYSLAFVSNRESRDGYFAEDSDIYLLQEPSRLLLSWCGEMGNERDPAFSADGRLPAFVSDVNGKDQIYVGECGTTDRERLRVSDGSANDREPAWSPDGQRIAFVSDRDGDEEIYVMNTDGSGLKRLTQDRGFDSSPAWSPDGHWIAFSSTRSGNGDLYMITPEGAQLTRLTNHPAPDGAPAWSPDGRQVAFMSQREGGNWEIYKLNIADGEIDRLTNDPAADQYPAWSGEQIAFMSARDGNFEIYVMNTDGSVPTRLTFGSAVDTHPAWTSSFGATALAYSTPLPSLTITGERIVFTSNRDGVDKALWVMTADGSQQTRLDTALNLDEQGVQQPLVDWDPQWSPDGKQIVFQSTRSGGERRLFRDNLWLIQADGTGLRLLARSGGGESPAWAPDNQRIAFENVTVHEIYVMVAVYADGRDTHTLFESLDVRNQDGEQVAMLWNLYSGLDWSPDGQRIAFVVSGMELWTAKIDGSDARLVVAGGYSPAWSPDGTRIAFMRDCGIWVVNDDGTGERHVFDEAGECESDPPIDLCPTWAPDGRQLAFHSTMDGDAEIYTINLDGSGLTQLTDNDAYDGCPDWSWR